MNIYIYIYINVYQFICFHIYAINVQMKKNNIVFLTLNYVEKISNDYGFHSFIKHDLCFPYKMKCL